MQSNGKAEMKATGLFIDAVLGLHSPVLRSQHQKIEGNLMQVAAGITG